MRKLPAIAAIAAFTSLTTLSTAHADITLTMHVSMEGAMKTQYDKMDAKTKAQMDKMLGYQMYISKGKMRTDTFMMTSLVDLNAGKSYALNTRDKSYYELPFQRGKAAMLPTQSALSGGVSVKNTHETSMMLGHKVRHYVISSHDAKASMKMDEYLATDFPADDMKAFKSGGQPILGVPLKMRMVMSGAGMPAKMDITIVTTAISSARIAKNLFDLPKDFTKTDMATIVSGKSKLLTAGTAAPDFTVYTQDGTPVKLSDYKGKAVMLDFWSTWCGPCQQSLPHSQALAAKYKTQGLVVLCVNVWDKKEEFLKWLPKHTSFDALNFVIDTTADSAQGVATKLYKVTGIPTVYVIGKDGAVAASEIGYHEGDASIEKAIQTALK